MNIMKSQDAIDTALKALLLNDPEILNVTESATFMQTLLQQSVTVDIDPLAERILLDRLQEVLQEITFGELITRQMALSSLTDKDVAISSRLPIQVISDIRQDNVFTNNIPVMLIKNLLSTLQLNFSEVERAVYRTFELLKSQAEPRIAGIGIPTFRKGLYLSKQVTGEIAQYAGSKELFENREALEKYMERLQDVLERS